VKVPAIPCETAIDKYVADRATRKQILRSFGADIVKFVCPDAASFDVWEKFFLQFSNPYFKEIKFFVEVKDGYKNFAKQTYI